MNDHGEEKSARSEEREWNVMNTIVEDAVRGYEVNIWASLTERDIIYRQAIRVG